MGVSGKDGKKVGMFKRLKNQIKSSFPEAIQDLKIMGGITALEAKVKKDIHDPKLFPEVDRVAEVRRGLDLGFEEKAFLEKRMVSLSKPQASFTDPPRRNDTYSGQLCQVPWTKRRRRAPGRCPNRFIRWQWWWIPSHDWLSGVLR